MMDIKSLVNPGMIPIIVIAVHRGLLAIAMRLSRWNDLDMHSLVRIVSSAASVEDK